jgi:hypothetical protein
MADGEYERVLDQVEAQQLVSLLSGLSERERMTCVRAGADVDADAGPGAGHASGDGDESRRTL